MEKYLAAANTEAGFFSLFHEVFSPEHLRRIYILKGGPGTGNSAVPGQFGMAGPVGPDASGMECACLPGDG